MAKYRTLSIGSVDQRASKSLAVKVGGLKKKSGVSAITAKLCASAIGLGLSLTES